jgi:hypothetical protein
MNKNDKVVLACGMGLAFPDAGVVSAVSGSLNGETQATSGSAVVA